MQSSRNSIDDDDIAAKLMPNVAKLIRAEFDSMESSGSTSMSFCRTSGKDKSEKQNPKPGRQRRGESVFRDVANKFMRRGSTGKRSIGVYKPSTLDTLSSHFSSSAERSNAYVFEKENLRPKAPTLIKQGTLPILQQKMAMRDKPQKGVRKNPSRSVVKLGQRRTVNPKMLGADKSNTVMISEHLDQHAATVTLPKDSHSSQGSEGSCYFPNLAAKSQRGKAKLYRKTMPLNMSELQEEFAELDQEALEEEEVSIAHLTPTRPVLASETVLQHADYIPNEVVENRKNLTGCGREDKVNSMLIPGIEEDTLPNYSHGQGQGGVGISTGQFKLSNIPGRDQEVQVCEPTCKGYAPGNIAASSGHNCTAITSPERQPSPSGHLNLDDPGVTISSPSVNGMKDEGTTADTKTPPVPLDASAQELCGTGTSVCAVFKLEHAESSFNDTRGYSSSKPDVDNFKVMTADCPDANAAHREDTVPGHTSTFRGDVRSAPSKAHRLLEQDIPDIPLQEGTYYTPDTSATPPRNPLLQTCLHHSRRGRSIDMSQRRLVFDSRSESPSRQKVVDKNSNDVSVSTVEFKSRTDPATGILNSHAHEFDASMTSIPRQESKIPFIDDEVIGRVDDMDWISQSSKPKVVTQCEGVVDTETPNLRGSHAQNGILPAFEASAGVRGKDPEIDSLIPQAEPATDCLKTRGLGKRMWANLGIPIDGGTEWKEGRRVSTRIKSRPLDWWRGERMLYGRVHSSKSLHHYHTLDIMLFALSSKFSERKVAQLREVPETD